MAAVLSLTMTLTMVTPVFAEGETNTTPAQTTDSSYYIRTKTRKNFLIKS